MQFHELHPSLPAWMAALETQLPALFDSEVPLLRDACVTVVGSPGKRLRPLLLFLACAAFDEVTPLVITNGCLVELVHTASLVHDDVVDEADARRGEPAAHIRWGNKFSILLGDYLLGRIFELATTDNDPGILPLLAPTATAMGRGVLMELAQLSIDADEATYWRVVHGKTASLFAAAMGMGALLGHAEPETRHAMYRLGECFGYAFQLADDLLDLQGSEQSTGKPGQHDWRQQRATLPLLYTLRQASPPAVAQLRTLWQQDPTEDGCRTISALVALHGGFDYGWEKVKEYLAEACDCLTYVPAGAGRDALTRLCTSQFPLPVMPMVG